MTGVQRVAKCFYDRRQQPATVAIEVASTDQRLQHDLESIQRARNPHTRPPLHQPSEAVLPQVRIHHCRLGVEVEEPAEPREQRHQHREKRDGDRERQMRLRRHVGREEHAGAPIEPEGPAIAVPFDRDHARDGVSLEQRGQQRPVERRSIGERQRHEVPAGARGERRHGGSGAPQGARAQPVALAEHGVEAPEALEPAGVRDPGDRQRGLGEEPLGEEQPMSLRQSAGETPSSRSSARRRWRSLTPSSVARSATVCPLSAPAPMRCAASRASLGTASMSARPGASSGRHRRQGRYPARSADAAESKNRRRSG